MAGHKVGRMADVYATSTIPQNIARTKAEIGQFFTRLEIVPPTDGAAQAAGHPALRPSP
jgi:hypothetical protein